MELTMKKTPKTEPAEAPEPKQNDLSAIVRRIEKRLDRTVSALEKMFGIDIDGNKKVGMILLACVLSMSSLALSPVTNAVFPLTDRSGTNVIFDVDSSGNVRAAGTLSLQTNVTIGGTLSLAAAAASTGTTVAAASIRLPEGYSTNAAKFITIGVGGTNYVVPVYVKP